MGRRVVAVVASQADLLQVVTALDARRRFADFLHGGQQQADQDGKDAITTSSSSSVKAKRAR
jgi:hypothetical protein